MNTWTPLWSSIVESSLIAEPDHVFKVFVALLAVKDSDHVARVNAFNLGRKCWPDNPKKSEKMALAALKVLSSPDRRRMEPQAHDGRRIQRVEDGWLVLNGEAYRRKVSDEMRKARWRRAQNAKRSRNGSTPLAGETAAVRALENGDEWEFERLAALAGEKGVDGRVIV